MRFIFCFCVSLFILNSYSAIYESHDYTGATIYSDEPQKNSAPVAISSPQTMSLPKQEGIITAQNQPVSGGVSASKTNYTNFSISSPIDQQTFHDQTSVKVSINVVPALMAGDRIQLFIDDIPAAPPMTYNEFTITDIEKGIHVIYAVLLSPTQMLKESAKITVFFNHIENQKKTAS